MVENKTKREVTSSKSDSARVTSSKSDSATRKDKFKKCIGSICFQEEGNSGYIDIKIDKKANPECAELANKFIMRGHKVRFTLEEDVDLENK